MRNGRVMKYLRSNIVRHSVMVALGLIIRANYGHLSALWTASQQMTRNQWHSRLGFEVVLLLLALFGASALILYYNDFGNRLLDSRRASD